jgi:hypothetical protein
MKIYMQKLIALWQRFFFEPQSPIPLALFRILYGCCIFGTLLLLHSQWLEWFGTHAWISQRSMNIMEPDIRLNLFAIIPQSDAWISALYWFCLVSSILLAVGLWSRFNSAIAFLCMTSLHQRNPFILHGGDDFLRVVGFFLVLAPAGAALSLDRIIRVRRGAEPRAVQPIVPWAQRMIQLELAFTYLMAFWHKLSGATWRNGTAVFYVLHYHALERFPLPSWMMSSGFIRAETWSVLSFQLSFALLVWFRRFRYPVLLCGLIFHLCLEYSLNIPMFQWDVLSAYVLFLDEQGLRRGWNWLYRQTRRRQAVIAAAAN